MDVADHNRNLKIIGKIFFVIGLLLVPVSIFSFFFVDAFEGFDFLIESEDINVLFLSIKPFSIVFFYPIFYSFLSILFIISGVGLVKERDWGRKVVLVPAVLLIFKFPVGTILGGYIIYATHSDQIHEANGV